MYEAWLDISCAITRTSMSINAITRKDKCVQVCPVFLYVSLYIYYTRKNKMDLLLHDDMSMSVVFGENIREGFQNISRKKQAL